MDNSEIDSIMILVWIVGVVLGIGALLVGAASYKEKFERNFIFNGAAWGIIIAEIIIFIGCAISAVQLEKIVGVGASTTGDIILYAVTFGHLGASVWFYFGAMILLITFATNINHSNFKWGMFQNIMQMILVTLFSVIIIIGSIMAKQKISEIMEK